MIGVIKELKEINRYTKNLISRVSLCTKFIGKPFTHNSIRSWAKRGTKSHGSCEKFTNPYIDLENLIFRTVAEKFKSNKTNSTLKKNLYLD